MKRRVVISLGVVFAVLVSVFFFMGPDTDLPLGDADESGQPTSSQAPAYKSEDVELQPQAQAEGMVPRSPQEEAVLAATRYSGEGIVRCRLPADIPDINLDPLNWAGVHDGVLTMAATESEGQVMLSKAGAPPMPRPPQLDVDDFDFGSPDFGSPDFNFADHFEETQREMAERLKEDAEAFRDAMADWDETWNKPFAVAAWEDAEPGMLGTCTVTPVKARIPISVRVVWDDGTPAAGARVMTGSLMGGVETDEDGRAEIEAWEGVPSVVSAFMMGTNALSMSRGMKKFTPTGPAVSVEIELEEPDLPSMAANWLFSGVRDKMEDTLAEHNEPLVQALEEEDLSVEARAQIQIWLDRITKRTDEMHDMLDEAEDLFEGSKDLFEGSKDLIEGSKDHHDSGDAQ